MGDGGWGMGDGGWGGRGLEGAKKFRARFGLEDEGTRVDRRGPDLEAAGDP